MGWDIDKNLLHKFQNCENENGLASFESPIFVNMFGLRCNPNKGGYLYLTSQLISIPISHDDDDGFPIICSVYEVTTKSIAIFDITFNYCWGDYNSSHCVQLMKSEKLFSI